MFAGTPAVACQQVTVVDNTPSIDVIAAPLRKPVRGVGFVTDCQSVAMTDKVRPTGFEPVALGSEVPDNTKVYTHEA